MRYLLLLASFMISTNVSAWGLIGHRTVGEVAKKFLTPEASLKVFKILKGNSLARVSTWPDEIRSEPQTYSYTFSWHYSDWADDLPEYDEQASSGSLLTSINEQLKILKDPAGTDDKKEFALKFLVHLVGDLHMPLHVGNGLDRGGNDCKVTFQGKLTNLHSVWDEELINASQLSFTELASFVSQGRTNVDYQSGIKGTVLDWALESKKLRLELYPEEVMTLSSPGPLKSYCRKDLELKTDQLPKLGYEYRYKFMPVIEWRLYLAGIRLASLLNQSL